MRSLMKCTPGNSLSRLAGFDQREGDQGRQGFARLDLGARDCENLTRNARAFLRLAFVKA
jgi:hypothetical protein